MTSITYETLALRWSPRQVTDHKFNIFTALLVLFLLLVALVLSSVELPYVEKKKRVVIPERVAKFITQKEKKKPVKLKPIPKPKIQIKPKRKPIDKKPLSKTQKKARKKAADSGLLALGNELSDLIDTKNINAMVGKKARKSSSVNTKAKVNTQKLSSNLTSGSGGISKKDTPTIVGSTKLSSHDRAAVREAITTTQTKDKSRKSYRGDGLRSEEEITFILDQNKSQFYSLYRRESRKNPGLKGKLILLITILPNGKVSDVVIRSSDLNVPSLERRIISRIKAIDFGHRGVEKVTVTFPLEFLPS